ncbi:hypothetical protein BDR26DRAFT_903797 [Obelidium mucronatum]|nr:hypothetical protein BDR26DRAFT_903797 [Obelidium mucronatum]
MSTTTVLTQENAPSIYQEWLEATKNAVNDIELDAKNYHYKSITEAWDHMKPAVTKPLPGTFISTTAILVAATANSSATYAADTAKYTTTNILYTTVENAICKVFQKRLDEDLYEVFSDAKKNGTCQTAWCAVLTLLSLDDAAAIDAQMRAICSTVQSDGESTLDFATIINKHVRKLTALNHKTDDATFQSELKKEFMMGLLPANRKEIHATKEIPAAATFNDIRLHLLKEAAKEKQSEAKHATANSNSAFIVTLPKTSPSLFLTPSNNTTTTNKHQNTTFHKFDTTTTVYVGNIDTAANKQDLKTALAGTLGAIERVRLVRNPNPNRPGFAFVQFKQQKDQQKALEANLDYGTHTLKFSKYEEKPRNNNNNFNNNSKLALKDNKAIEKCLLVQTEEVVSLDEEVVSQGLGTCLGTASSFSLPKALELKPAPKAADGEDDIGLVLPISSPISSPSTPGIRQKVIKSTPKLELSYSHVTNPENKILLASAKNNIHPGNGILDSGATQNISNNAFFKQSDRNPRTYQVGNNATITGSGKEGSITGIAHHPDTAKPDQPLTITRVEHVPHLSQTLYSVNQLQNDGYDIWFTRLPDKSKFSTSVTCRKYQTQ